MFSGGNFFHVFNFYRFFLPQLPCILAIGSLTILIIWFIEWKQKNTLVAIHGSVQTKADTTSDMDGFNANDFRLIFDGLIKGLGFKPPEMPPNLELKQLLMAEVLSWNIHLSPTLIRRVLQTGCDMAAMAYRHTDVQHQVYIALYTAYIAYGDDYCKDNLNSIGQFSLRFANGQRQQDPVLDRFATHIKKAHELWPLVGANAIVCATLDFMTALYIEYTTKTMTISHHAKRYPYHLRLMSGISSPFAYFMFPKTWRDNVNSYLQFIPDLVFFINCSNDLASFYKESLAGERKNYVHLRATVEHKSPDAVLRELSSEVIDAVDRIKAAVAADSELATVCDSFFNGVIEFHIKTPRYRLNELGFSA